MLMAGRDPAMSVRRRAGETPALQAISARCAGSGRYASTRPQLPWHRRALEEARVLRAPQPHGIAEHEVVEIAFGDVAVLDQLERLAPRVAAGDDIEMPD